MTRVYHKEIDHTLSNQKYPYSRATSVACVLAGRQPSMTVTSPAQLHIYGLK